MNKDDMRHRVQQQSGQDVIVFLDQVKLRKRRRNVYRSWLLVSILVSCAILAGLLYYQIDHRLPSIINVRAGKVEVLDLGIPAKAQVVSVSKQGVSNVPAGSIDIDLSRPVTLKAADADNYGLQVKLFGFLNFKEIDLRVIEDQELIPVGMPVGIYVKTKGVMVIGTGEFQTASGDKVSPSKGLLKSGDYILYMNGVAVSDKDDFMKMIRFGAGKPLTMTVIRDGKELKQTIHPQKDTKGEYKIGLWVRDSAQGIGTMTYMDGEGNFGALGHGIADVDTSDLMTMDDGTLYMAEVVDIKKGAVGKPGEMTGLIVYSNDRILGDINNNCERGIFGRCNKKAGGKFRENPVPIGLKQEITSGPAQIICTVDGVPKYYDIEINDINLNHSNVNRGIELTVVDEELLAITGGIVQGMSGSPILQNGKIVGAVTHVLVNDPTRGYGIFIENMLQH